MLKKKNSHLKSPKIFKKLDKKIKNICKKFEINKIYQKSLKYWINFIIKNNIKTFWVYSNKRISNNISNIKYII